MKIPITLLLLTLVLSAKRTHRRTLKSSEGEIDLKAFDKGIDRFCKWKIQLYPCPEFKQENLKEEILKLEKLTPEDGFVELKKFLLDINNYDKDKCTGRFERFLTNHYFQYYTKEMNYSN